jgi:restriction system protein
MPQSGGRSQWERQVAAQRREAEQQAKEEARRQKEEEKARKLRHLESQQREAEAKTAAVERRIKLLDEVLTSILPLSPLSFERLKVSPQISRFDPGPLGRALPAPDWSQFAPAEPSALARLFGGELERRRPSLTLPWCNTGVLKISDYRL